MSEKQQIPSAGPDFVTKLPQDQCGDEDSRALKHALSETPMQSDQIVQLAQAIRLLAFHVDMKIIHPGGSCCIEEEYYREAREELRGIRDNMEDLIFTIKGR